MHIFGFYYKNISRCTLLRMSNLRITALLSFKPSRTSYPVTQRRFPLDPNPQQFLTYRMFHEKLSIFWEVILSGIVRRKIVEISSVSEGLPRYRYQNLQTPLVFVGLDEISLAFWILLPHRRKVKIHSDEQHAIFAHMLQNALRLTVGFWNIYCELQQLCHVNNTSLLTYSFHGAESFLRS